ncbi:putative metabolite transport protein GIT1 [Emericellopsis cladophorae]|uniref:Metabolite transport protein GIT1 n=1 Tax=Emericellopsis cladophorae TaxID=2686198 RepID=A0A9P9XZU3_9HYPO|nr:putative metabolite transport protein GIT1 [Emericellopsis cladophorae]KAI6780958.1 putative metabolite transport protein GIT1 [Emericellopsis cladophorae]
MSATTEPEIQATAPHGPVDVRKPASDKDEANVETGSIDEPEKGSYSKLSVWLMVLFSGLAIGSDGYNAAVIGNLQLMLKVLYPDALTSDMSSRLSNSFLIGMIIGMLFFGVIVDQLGRKTGAIATTVLLVLGIALSAAANGTSPQGLIWMLVVARGIAGVGAGGEYPVSGAGAAEATDESGAYRKHRGFMFAMLATLSASLGYVWAALVPLLLLLCVNREEGKYEIVWRTAFALGAIPPLGIFWFRIRMAVATAYRKSSMRKQKVPYLLAVKRYYRPLIGVASCWFLYNWISIPFGIFSSTIIARSNAGNSLVKNLGWGCLINCFYLPGPFIGGVLSDRIGRRKTMALGFMMQAVLGFVLGGAMKQIQSIFPLFIVLYGIFLTLGEVGPGSTVVLTASECFPTSIRGQMMGFISACSKAGAAIGTQVFTALLNNYASNPEKGDQVAFLVGSAFAVLGALVAFFVIPDVSRNLDDDDAAWKVYLADNGWDAQWGDTETKDPTGVMMNRARD